MANYKVVDADKLDNSLRSIADTIRAKNGTTEDIKFPEGYIAAYESTPTIIENVEANLNFANGDQMESLPEGYAARSVKIKKPENLTPENIAEGVTIAGIVGTHEGGCDHNIIDNVEVALDFSNGDMTETLPEGYSANSVTIFKPDTLIAENIAEGVTIAGIVGTHKGGGGGGGGAATDEPYVSYGYDDNGNVISAAFHNCIEIPRYMFYQNTTLNSVDLSGSPNLTKIGYYSFNGCTNLTSITLPESVTTIDYGAFYGCSKLTSINIPNSCTSIGSNAFSSCSKLTSITIPNSVTSIGTNAFYKCSGLQSVTLLANITTIQQATFAQCTDLTSINIPDTVTSIGMQAFYKCNELSSIALPESLTSIGKEAFWLCSALTSITIPAKVTSIGTNAFYECSNLATVINKSSLAITAGATSYGYVAYYATSVTTG